MKELYLIKISSKADSGAKVRELFAVYTDTIIPYCYMGWEVCIFISRRTTSYESLEVEAGFGKSFLWSSSSSSAGPPHLHKEKKREEIGSQRRSTRLWSLFASSTTRADEGQL